MSILQIEEIIKRNLPNDFKKYIESLESEFLNPSCSFTIEVPNAFGGSAIVDSINLCTLDYLKADENYELGMLCIGGNVMGNLLYMSIRDKDYGSIYYWDHDNKYFWEDDFFYKMFPNLHKDIVKYLKQRKNGELPAKEENYENFYLVALTFKEFLVKLIPEEY